jgi:hypothetical protein
MNPNRLEDIRTYIAEGLKEAPLNLLARWAHELLAEVEASWADGVELHRLLEKYRKKSHNQAMEIKDFHRRRMEDQKYKYAWISLLVHECKERVDAAVLGARDEPLPIGLVPFECMDWLHKDAAVVWVPCEGLALFGVVFNVGETSVLLHNVQGQRKSQWFKADPRQLSPHPNGPEYRP